MRKIFLVLLTLAVFGVAGLPKAKAMDPITIAILAPYALPYAEAAGIWTLKGLVNASDGVAPIFTSMVDIFMLPVGLLEITLGAPFGLFKSGCQNLLTGTVAPFKFCFSTFMLLPLFLRLA
ncbi:MAG TPA: hypothetical protein DET40_04220 [Lentisphaeria bacterium]|nr:MAG: hypothetical protein A2X45_06465 [Lentisphaerae bacterium GWF2_50_93]HCE42731.1 hypothetical protein [Lentisphaeria bacterium]